MTGIVWLLIGVAGGAAGTGLFLFTRAIRDAFRDAFQDLGARIDAVLEDTPDEAEPHAEDDVWDRDLRQLITDTID